MRITIIIEESRQGEPVVTIQGTGAGTSDVLSGVEASLAQMSQARPGATLDGGLAPGRAGDSWRSGVSCPEP